MFWWGLECIYAQPNDGRLHYPNKRFGWGTGVALLKLYVDTRELAKLVAENVADEIRRFAR